MATITHKQGDTLEWIFNLTESNIATDVTSWTIRSHVRQTDDTLIQALTVTKTDPTNGVFSLSATAAQTDAWPAGDHKVDVEFTDASSVVFSTSTFTLTVVEDISHD